VVGAAGDGWRVAMGTLSFERGVATLGQQIGFERELGRLVEAARLPQVRLQVLPFSAGAHIGLTGPFVIFSFSRTSDLDVVVLDHLTSSLYLERKEDLQAYTEAFNALRANALSPGDSSDYIAAIADGA
jgi:hypothetical protein